MLLRPGRFSDEHEIGHWLRQAHQNGLRDPRWMLDPQAHRGATTLRVCPSCLRQEDAHWRTAWLDINHPWCAAHQTWLVDRCPACHRTLRWGQTRLLECRCGRDLREIETENISDQVAGALKVAPIPVLLWLGAVGRFGFLGKPLKRASRQTVADMASLIEFGAAQIDDWPEAFFLTLDGSRAREAEPASDRLELLGSALPGISKRLAKIRDPAWRAKLTEAVGDYVGSHRRGLPSLVWKNAPGDRPPSVATVAKGLGIGTARLTGALDGLAKGGVPTRRTAGGRCRRVVSDEAAMAAKEFLNSRIALKPAARLLGLSVPRLKQLITEGVFDTSDGKLDRAAVAGLCSRLLAIAEEGRATDDGVTLNRALRYDIPIGKTGALVEALLSNEIPCFLLRAPMKPAVLQLSLSNVRSWSAQHTTAGQAWLTIPEATVALGLKQQVVYHLVRMGLIDACTQQVRKRRAQVVTWQALLDFKSRFVPLAWAAAHAGIDHRNGMQWALDQDLEIATGPSIDGGRQYFIRVGHGACSKWAAELWSSAAGGGSEQPPEVKGPEQMKPTRLAPRLT